MSHLRFLREPFLEHFNSGKVKVTAEINFPRIVPLDGLEVGLITIINRKKRLQLEVAETEIDTDRGFTQIRVTRLSHDPTYCENNEKEISEYNIPDPMQIVDVLMTGDSTIYLHDTTGEIKPHEYQAILMIEHEAKTNDQLKPSVNKINLTIES